MSLTSVRRFAAPVSAAMIISFPGTLLPARPAAADTGAPTATFDEERQCRELAISLERTAHGRERGRVAQAQRGEALTERRDRDEARVGGGLGHASTSPRASRRRTSSLGRRVRDVRKLAA